MSETCLACKKSFWYQRKDETPFLSCNKSGEVPKEIANLIALDMLYGYSVKAWKGFMKKYSVSIDYYCVEYEKDDKPCQILK